MSQLSAYELESADRPMWMIWWVFDEEKMYLRPLGTWKKPHVHRLWDF